MIDNAGVADETIEKEGEWGLERRSGWEDFCWAPAVRKKYEPNTNASLIFPEGRIDRRDFFIEYEIQPNLQDPGRLLFEVRTDQDRRWREVRRYTGFRSFF